MVLKNNTNLITSLEEFVNQAELEVNEDFILNYMISNTISISDLKEKPISDCTDEATLWAAKEKPKELQINHGQYIKTGLDYIISELDRKETSNRALFSLISHDHIVESKDSPIPSFMIMQCNIYQDTLYCTSYFRALEVSTFFRINLEELRLKICDIYEKIPKFKNVKITIFAFRAYINRNINTLRKPEIDRLTAIQIFKMLGSNRRELADLLREKSHASTVIETDSIKYLIESLDDDSIEISNKKSIIIKAKKAINLSNNLLDLREIASHHHEIEELNQKFHTCIMEIAQELESE